MTQKLSLSRITELKREIELIANCPKATKELATKHALGLISMYPGQQNQDERVAKMYFNSLVDLLCGQDLDVLDALANPRTPRGKWLPSVPEVAAFIDQKMEPKRTSIGFYLGEIAILEDRDVAPVSDEERERVAARAREAAKLIRRTAALKDMGEPRKPTPQIDCWGTRLNALRNLEAMNGRNHDEPVPDLD